MSSDTESVMTGDNGSIEVILVRMEGKIDRLGDRMNIFERDQNSLRSRVHDMANEMQLVIGLGLPDRIRVSDQHNAKVDARLQALEDIEQQRKGAAALAKVLWAIGGALGISGIAGIVAVFKGVF